MRFEVTAQFAIEADNADEADSMAFERLAFESYLDDVEIVDVVEAA